MFWYYHACVVTPVFERFVSVRRARIVCIYEFVFTAKDKPAGIQMREATISICQSCQLRGACFQSASKPPNSETFLAFDNPAWHGMSSRCDLCTKLGLIMLVFAQPSSAHRSSSSRAPSWARLARHVAMVLVKEPRVQPITHTGPGRMRSCSTWLHPAEAHHSLPLSVLFK